MAFKEEAEVLQQSLELISRTLLQPNTIARYCEVLEDYIPYCLKSGFDPLTPEAKRSYIKHLSERGMAASTINIFSASVNKLVEETANDGNVGWETVGAVRAIKPPRRFKPPPGRSLNRSEIEALCDTLDPDTTQGARQLAIIATLIGSGLRRSELCSLTFEHLQIYQGRWVIARLRGKGGKIRTIPVGAWVVKAIRRWARLASIVQSGHVFRCLTPLGGVTKRPLEPGHLNKLIRLQGQLAGLGRLTVHDLRRTFGRLAYRGGSPIEQIQHSYGHSRIETTMQYLGIGQDFEDAPADRLGLEL